MLSYFNRLLGGTVCSFFYAVSQQIDGIFICDLNKYSEVSILCPGAKG